MASPYSKTDDAFCQLAYSFRKNSPLVLLSIVQALMSLITLVFLYLVVFKCRELRRIWAIVELNLKIITVAGLFFYVLSSVNSFSLFVYKSFILLLNFEPCFYVWSGVGCFATQTLYASTCTIAHALFHFALLVERSHVSFSKRKNSLNGLVGMVLAFIMVVLSPFPQINLLTADDFNVPRPFCAFTFLRVDTKTISSAYFVICFDFLITFGDISLYFYNKRMILKQKRKPNNFNLRHSFNLRSMEISIRFIWPFSVVHSLTYSIQILFYSFLVRASMDWQMETVILFYEFNNFLRLFSNMTLFVFVYFYSKRIDRTPKSIRVQDVNTFDLHFKEFQKIIA